MYPVSLCNCFNLAFDVQSWTRGFPFNVRQCPLVTQKNTSVVLLKYKKGQDKILDLRVPLFLMFMRSRKAGLPFATRARKRELCLQSYVSRITRTENFLSQKFSVHQCPSEPTNVRPSPSMSVRIRQCLSQPANVRPSPPMSVRVRQCPSESANVRPSPPMSVRARQCPSESANVR